MTIRVEDVLDAVVSHAMSLGVFDAVNTAEPKRAPGNNLQASIWFEAIRPARSSGLKATSMVLEFNIRLYSSLFKDDPDLIDPEVIKAVDLLFTEFNGNYTLLYDGEDMVRQVDVFGSEGTPLTARSGYVQFEENREYRVVDITLPLIIDDVWQQGGS